MHAQRRIVAVRADGTRFPVEANLSRTDAPGEGSLCTVLLRDVSDQRRAEQALRDSEARYRAIFEHAVVGISQMDLEGRIIGANARLCQMLDYPVDELLKLRTHDVTHPDDLADNLARMRALAHGGPPYTVEKRLVRRDGSTIWIEAAFSALRSPAGVVSSIVATGIDIDSRKRATQALQRSHAELRRLSASLTSAREQERRHIARELHDELGQCLSAIKMEIASLASASAHDDPALPQRLQRLLATVDDTILSARRIAADLRPAMRGDLGLNAALEWLVKNWSSRAGVEVDLAADDVDDVLDEAAATAIYRIAQEALNNVGRHAHAMHADVLLTFEADDLVLRVEDDGAGLAPGAVDKDGSHGLLGIRERVHMLGGSVTIANARSGGCRLEVRLPLARIDVRATARAAGG
jgi:PAS domain S-box-containing protein